MGSGLDTRELWRIGHRLEWGLPGRGGQTRTRRHGQHGHGRHLGLHILGRGHRPSHLWGFVHLVWHLPRRLHGLELVEIESVFSKATQIIAWRDLQNNQIWLQGWV